MTTEILHTVDLNALPMRVAVGQFNDLTDEPLAFVGQIGAQDVQLNTPNLPGEERWEYEDLLALRQQAETQGLRLICLENMPIRFYDKIMAGAEDCGQQIEGSQRI